MHRGRAARHEEDVHMIVAAIDTGGTKIAGAAVNEKGEILKRCRVENTGRTGAFILDAYRRILDELGREYPIGAIGIGAGGRIDERQGKVLDAVRIYSDYIGLEIKKTLEGEYHLPVAVTNDCRAAILGERWQGEAGAYQDLVGIILGTGVGGGIVCEGQLLLGDKGGMGEIGHIILHPGGRACTCGQRGCAEQYVSGTALWSLYNERTAGEHIASGYEFFERVKAGDQAAGEVLDQFVRDLAVCAVSCVNAYDPQALLFGGGLLDTSDIWWDGFVREYEICGSDHARKKKLLRAGKGNDAALLGAAWLALGGPGA